MLIMMLLVGAKIVLAFLGALLLVIMIQLWLYMLSETHPAIDHYTIVLIFWTLAFTLDLPQHGKHIAPIILGFVPVARAHCHVIRKRRSRYPLLRIIMESFRNAAAPFRTARTLLTKKRITCAKRAQP